MTPAQDYLYRIIFDPKFARRMRRRKGLWNMGEFRIPTWREIPVPVNHWGRPLPDEYAPMIAHGVTLAGLQNYAWHRVPPGGFLTAVLQNDLMEAAQRMDHYNAGLLRLIVQFMHNHLPSDCYGSPEKVSLWLNPPEPAAAAVAEPTMNEHGEGAG